jgi:F0F1-type ATP synthase delta subunit
MLTEREYEVLKHIYEMKVMTKIELMKKIGKKNSKHIIENILKNLIDKNYIKIVSPVSINCFVITRLGEEAVENYE